MIRGFSHWFVVCAMVHGFTQWFGGYVIVLGVCGLGFCKLT